MSTYSHTSILIACTVSVLVSAVFVWNVQGFKLALYPDKEEGEEKDRLRTRVGFTHRPLMFSTSFCILCLPPGVCLVSGYLCDFNHPPPPPVLAIT